MADDKITDKNKPELHAEKHALNTADAQSARNSDAEQIKVIQDTNPNQHSGSAGGDQDHSIEIVGFEATASRGTKLTEKDLIGTPLLKGHVELNSVTEQGVLERIAALPFEKQAQIIGAGIDAYSHELNRQQFRIFVGAVAGIGDATVGLAQGAESLCRGVYEVAQFSKEVMLNDPAAIGKAENAGAAVGKLLVGGVRIWQLTDTYLGDIGATGEYAKPLKDIAWLGQQIDQRWQGLSPEEKTRLTAKLAVENLAGLAVGLGTTKLAKSAKITEALEQLGSDASQLGGASRDKASKFISKFLDELMPQEMAVTPDGQRIPVPRQPRDNVLMSKADDLNEGHSPHDRTTKDKPAIEKFQPSEKFVAQLERVIQSLDPDELEYLKEHNVRINAVRRITDIKPELNAKTLGIYDPSSKTIYVAEEMLSFGKWVPNNDVMFELRHEFGHAYNATAHRFGEWMSNEPMFKAAFKKDLDNLTPTQRNELPLSSNHKLNMELARDEVYADMYAHAIGLESNNQYSKTLKALFPACLAHLKEEFIR